VRRGNSCCSTWNPPGGRFATGAQCGLEWAADPAGDWDGQADLAEGLAVARRLGGGDLPVAVSRSARSEAAGRRWLGGSGLQCGPVGDGRGEIHWRHKRWRSMRAEVATRRRRGSCGLGRWLRGKTGRLRPRGGWDREVLGRGIVLGSTRRRRLLRLVKPIFQQRFVSCAVGLSTHRAIMVCKRTKTEAFRGGCGGPPRDLLGGKEE